VANGVGLEFKPQYCRKGNKNILPKKKARIRLKSDFSSGKIQNL
jgi:RNase P subunit RPR2